MAPAKNKKTIKNQRQSQANPSGRLPFLLSICFILLGLSVFVNIKTTRLSALEMNNGHSSAFRGRGIEDQVKLPDEATATEFPVGRTTIGFDTPPNTTGIGLYLLYKCEAECQEFWLEYPMNGQIETVAAMPIHHELAKDRNWLRVLNENSVIYQKRALVFSIEDLAQSEYRIITEPQLLNDFRLQSPNLTLIQDNPKPEDADIIFTSRLPQADVQGWHKYVTVLKADNIKKNTEGLYLLTFRVAQPTRVLNLMVTYDEN